MNLLIDNKGHAVVADYKLASIIDSSEFTSDKTAGTCRWTASENMNLPNNDDVTLNYSHQDDHPESSYSGRSQNVNALADLYYFR